MRWTVLSLSLLLSGCGAVASEPDTRLTLRTAASPRSVELGWSESYGEAGRVLRFEVESFAVEADGWRAAIALENGTGVAWELGSRPLALAFGLMLFGDGRLKTLEELNRAGALPPVRKAVEIEPAPPRTLPPGSRWDATLRAPGSLPAGSWVRMTFGTLFATGEPPAGLEPRVVWITDRAYRL